MYDTFKIYFIYACMIPSKYSACIHEMKTKFNIPLSRTLFHSPASNHQESDLICQDHSINCRPKNSRPNFKSAEILDTRQNKNIYN